MGSNVMHTRSKSLPGPSSCAVFSRNCECAQKDLPCNRAGHDFNFHDHVPGFDPITDHASGISSGRAAVDGRGSGLPVFFIAFFTFGDEAEGGGGAYTSTQYGSSRN